MSLYHNESFYLELRDDAVKHLSNRFLTSPRTGTPFCALVLCVQELDV